MKDAHRTLQQPLPHRETPLYQEIGGSDLYPVPEHSLTKRQRSIEDLKFELQQRRPSWRQKHSSGEDNSTSSSSEEDQADKIRQKKAVCSSKLEVVLPEVYRQQGAVPKVKTPPKKHEPNLEEDKAKYLHQSDWNLPLSTPASLYKAEQQQPGSPQKTNRQLFSMPVATRSKWEDLQKPETSDRTPPSTPQVYDQISPPESHREFFHMPTPTKLDQDETPKAKSRINTTSSLGHLVDHQPESHRQLFSMPIPTKCSRNDSQRAETRINRTPPSNPEVDYSSRGVEALDRHINRGQFSDRLSNFASHGFNRDSLVPNYYDTSFSSMQSINQQLSSLSLVECSTDTCAETSSGCTEDDNDDGEGEHDDIDWEWDLDNRTPRLRTSSERTVSTEEEDNGITFSAKSSDDLQFEDGGDVGGREEFWDTSSSWMDEGVTTQVDNYSEISDDDSFVTCLGSFSSSPCLASFTPRQQLEDQLRKQFKHRDIDTSHVIRPSSGSGPNSPAKSTKHVGTANKSSPKHDNQSPVRTNSKFTCKDSPTHTRPSPTSSPRHNRTRGFSLDSHDFKADIPAPFHRPVPSPTEPPVCAGSAFNPVFSKSKSLLRSVIGKENVPQGNQVSGDFNF